MLSRQYLIEKLSPGLAELVKVRHGKHAEEDARPDTTAATNKLILDLNMVVDNYADS